MTFPTPRRTTVACLAVALFASGLGTGVLATGAIDGAVRTHGRSSEPTCPTADPANTKAMNERSENCEMASSIEEVLRRSGAERVLVSVTRADSTTLLGPAQRLHVLASMRLPQRMRAGWNAEQVRTIIASAVGTTPDQVDLVDETLVPL